MQRISRPLLDRIDISVEVKPLSFLEAAEDIKEESSDAIRNLHYLLQRDIAS